MHAAASSCDRRYFELETQPAKIRATPNVKTSFLFNIKGLLWTRNDRLPHSSKADKRVSRKIKRTAVSFILPGSSIHIFSANRHKSGGPPVVWRIKPNK